MMKLFRYCLFIFLPFLSAFKFIPLGATEDILKQAQEGQGLIFSRRYDEGQAYFEKLAQQYPDSPLGTFGLMALYNAKMFENFDFTLDSNFDQVQRRNKEIVEKIDKNPSASAWDNFLCGASSGLRGFYFFRKDAYFKALGEAKQARRCLEQALKLDPRFSDVYLGLGLYDYWTGVFSTRFKFIPLFKDKRKEGKAEIQRAITEGTIANLLAKAALVFIWNDEKNGVQGLPLAQELLKDYPNNVIMRNLEGNFLSYTRQHDKAQAAFDKVLQLDPKINVARYFKAMDYYRAGRLVEARSLFEEFLKNNPPPAWQAYTHYMLGTMDLRDNQREKALEHFKAGSRTYGDYKPNLQMILKMRRGEK